MNVPIEVMEEKLRQAVLSSNVYALEEMLADDLVFIDPAGRSLSKAEDVEVYRRGLVSVARFEVIERRVRTLGDIAVVHSLVAISGRALGTAFDGQFHQTRVWNVQSGRWRVISAHASAAQR
ncbi:MAG: nuclear transport factor 2 family protein [Verrucomicrobiaceae bacterium]|nr:MAG: nuclear transport factor 2 family protein [Verrucomicrobiaceae bacterium]